METIRDYFKINGGQFYIYNNLVKVEDVALKSMHELLAHSSSLKGKSVAMLVHEAVLQDFGSVKGRKVLDLGCGTGHFTCLMAEDGAVVTAVDRNPLRVDVVRELVKLRGLGNVTVLWANIEDYAEEIRDEYDLILMHNVFEYVPDECKARLLHRLSMISDKLYSMIHVPPKYVTDNSDYEDYRELLHKIYGERSLWVFN